jgi:RNA polymerase sigma-70 factor (ECF subfamily)
MNVNNPSDAFLAVIEAHKGILYKVAHSYAKNKDDHKDLIQETILQLWRSFELYDERYQHSTWIYRIALNVAISFYRKEKRRDQMLKVYRENVFQWVGETAPIENAGPIKMLEKCIAELKDMDKALMLLYLEEKPHREIAAIIGISETNVSTKIDRIKKILKQKLSILIQ